MRNHTSLRATANSGLMVANPLCNRNIFRSWDIEEAQQLVAQTASPHKLDILSRKRGLATQYDGVLLKEIALLHVNYGTAVRVQPIEEKDLFFTQTTLCGKSRVQHGNDSVDTAGGSTTVVSPTMPYHMDIDDNSQRLLVMFHRSGLENHLSRMINKEITEPLVFDLDMGANEQAQSSWLRTVRYLCQQHNEDDGLMEQADIQRHSSDLMMSLLLNLQPHNYSAFLQEEGSLHTPRHVRRAITYIEDNIDRSLSIADIASHVGVAVRTLQKGFQRYRNQTPAEYVRSIRLGRVHQALQAQCNDQSVTEILLGHGVTSFGHFARFYKNKYGVTPCETLKHNQSS